MKKELALDRTYKIKIDEDIYEEIEDQFNNLKMMSKLHDYSVSAPLVRTDPLYLYDNTDESEICTGKTNTNCRFEMYFIKSEPCPAFVLVFMVNNLVDKYLKEIILEMSSDKDRLITVPTEYKNVDALKQLQILMQ